jgi:hypothetical protein
VPPLPPLHKEKALEIPIEAAVKTGLIDKPK